MYAFDFFDSFKEDGFVSFAKESNSLTGRALGSEWSFLKVHPGFFD